MLSNTIIENVNKVIPKKYYNNLPKDYRGHQYRTTHIGKYGKVVKIKQFSDFVSIKNITLEYSNRGIKATEKIAQNYRAKYQITYYFDKKGNEILPKNGLTDRQIFYKS